MIISKKAHDDLQKQIQTALSSIADLRSSVRLLIKLRWTQKALNEFVDILKDQMDALKDMADNFKDALDELKD